MEEELPSRKAKNGRSKTASSKKPTPKPKPKRVSATQRNAIRFLWESGNYTFSTLSTTFSICIDTLKYWSKKHGWQKGALEADVAREVKKRTVDVLAELGMPERELLRLLVKGAKRTTCTKTFYSIHVGSRGGVVSLGESRKMVDNEVTLKYRQEILKMFGLYAAPKAPVEESEGEDAEESRRKKYTGVSVENLKKARDELRRLIDE